MRILKQKNESKTKLLTVRLPISLVEDLDSMKADAAAAGYIFDSSEVIERALASAIKAARAELNNHKQA